MQTFTPASKKTRLLRAWSSGFPIWCSWQVTYRCNFRCRFCQYWHDPLGQQPEPPVSQYALGARKLAQLGTLLVSLAGGEPLLRPDLPELVEAVGRYHFPFVTTNGWFVTPPLADDLMRVGLWGASVSIDYADSSRHDRRRGMDGAWEQAWRAVELLGQARRHDYQRVNVMAVLLEDNLDQVEPLIAMAADRGAYFMVQPYGCLKTGARTYTHRGPEVSARLLELRRRWPNFLSNPRYLAKFDQFLAGGVPGCKAGQAFFNIDSAGDVAVCVERRSDAIGNLYRQAMGTLVERLKQAHRANTCTQCWYNCRGEVESLYRPAGLLASLPTLLLDRGRAPRRDVPKGIYFSQKSAARPSV
jgi:MoaA/NifB/PqqE/SkfB family radical SAM enzyme